MFVFRLWRLDVHGNEDDWTVNDRMDLGSIELPSSFTDQDSDQNWQLVLDAMNMYFKPDTQVSDLEFDYQEDDLIHINDRETGEPLFDLEFDHRAS